MKNIYTLMPNRLNLNGEQGNVLVLKKRLEWLGVEVNIVPMDTISDFAEKLNLICSEPTNSLIFIGQGSLESFSALEQHREKLKVLIENIESFGVPTLIVGTLYELLLGSTKLDTFKSEFEKSYFEPGGFEVLGYASTWFEMPTINLTGSSVVWTVLHGPILAKNPKLADWYLNKLQVQIAESTKFNQVDEIVDRIWELESP